MERERKMDNNNNQPLVQPVQQPQMPPVEPQMAQPVQPQSVQQPVYQQPVYQQPYQQVQPQYVPDKKAPLGIQPTDMFTPEEQAQRRKKATILCIISLVCQFAPEVFGGIFSGIVEGIGEMSNSSALEPLTYISSMLVGGTYIASWVLMIIARVKYKESKFAKVLMWVYIGILVASVIAIVLIVAMCAYMLKDCQGF